MGFKDWKNTQAAGVVSEAQPPQPADGGRTSFRQWKKSSAKQSAVSPTVQPAAAQDTGKQSAVASIKSAVQSRTQALRLDPAQAEQDLLGYSARLRELEQQPMGVSDGAVEYLEGAKTRYEAIGRALEDMLPQAQADPAQYAERYNALLRQYEEAGRNYTISAQRYNRQVGAAQQNIDAYNETLRRYRETQAALDNYTRMHKNEPAKLEAQAKALSLEADWLDKRAGEIEKDVIGYENMHPETGRSASTLYRDMSPEQVGEYMQEHVWGPLQEAGAMRDPAKAEAMRTRAAQLAEQAQAAQARVDSMEYREQMRSYLPLMQSADWAEKSKADPAKLEGRAPQVVATQDESGMWHQTVISTGYDDLEYAIINGAEGALGMDDAVAADSAGVLSRAYLTQMTDEERGIYNYLYSTEGKKAAQEFLEQIKPRLEKAQRAEDQTWWRAQAQKKPWAMSAFTVLASPLSAISLFGQALDLATRGSIDKDAAYNRFTYIPSTIRDEVAQQVKKAWGPETGNLGSFLYQTGMSMADFLFQSAVTGGFAGGTEEAAGSALARTVEKFTRPTLLVMGTNAAASTVQQLMDEGMDSTRAFILGVAAGFAEILTENVSLEALLNPDELADGVIKYIMKNMLAEGSEEAASDVLNWSADALYDLISGQSKSEWKRSVRELETGGMSRVDAVNHLLTQRITELGLDALGGALSGGVMGVGGTAINRTGGRDSTVNAADLLQAAEEQRETRERQEPVNLLETAQQAETETETETQLPKPLQAALDKLAAGEDISLNNARRVMEDGAAMQTLRDAGVLTEEVRNDSAGRKAVADAIRQYGKTAESQAVGNLLETAEETRDTGVETKEEAKQAETGTKEEAPQPEPETREEAPQKPASEERTETSGEPAKDDRIAQRTLANNRRKLAGETSLQESGFTTAGESATRVQTEDSWDAEEQAVGTALREAGYEPTFTAGLILDAEGNAVPYLIEGDRIAIQADNRTQSVKTIAEQAVGKQLNVDEGARITALNDAQTRLEAQRKAAKTKVNRRAEGVRESAKAAGVSEADTEKAVRLANLLKRDIRFYSDPEQNGNWENGYTQGGVIYVNAAVNKHPMEWVIGHELTHNTEHAKAYQGLRKIAKQAYGAQWDSAVQKRMDAAARIAESRGDQSYTLSREQAEREITADYFATELLTNEDAIRRICQYEPNTARRILEYLKNLLAKWKGKEPTLEWAIDRYSEAMRQSSAELRESRLELPGAKAQSAADIKAANYSVQSVFNAAGFDVKLRGGRVIAMDENGVQIREMTEDMVRRSGIGTMVRFAQEVTKSVTAEEAQTQIEGLTRLFNLILKAQDGDMVWRFAGSAMFSAVKSNSDGQYKTTIDFSTVCKKTQEMMETMSKVMVKNHRGLSKSQIIELQNDILEENGLVPCPVCYVFSRWAGVGGILDNMAKYQRKYDGAEWDDPARVQARIDQLKAAAKSKKTLQELLKQEDSSYMQFTGELEENRAEQKQLKAERKKLTGKKANAEENAARVAEIDRRLKELAGLANMLEADIKAIESSGAPEAAWLERVRMSDRYRDEGYVEEDLLYDLLKADELAERKPLAWGYRTSRGPSAGKAILPYSDMRIGDWILGPGGNSAKGANTLFSSVGEEFTKDQLKTIKTARQRVLAQNLIGGQRYQSTSDFMYDYGLDYLLSFFEGQMLGSKMQTYTKVMEFVNLVASVHGDVNISMMPLDAGYVTEADGRKHLVYSSVTGANPEAAIRANALFDNAQLILVGINDEHILLALEDSEETGGAQISFVIPYHASGASINNFIRGLVENLGETFDETHYKNYEPMQNDSSRANATEQQQAMERLRHYLLTGRRGKAELNLPTGNENGLTDVELKALRRRSKDIRGMSFDELRAIEKAALAGDRAAIREYESWSAGFLGDLYRKMWTNEKAAETYGVRLSGDQAAHIMPHEYWDTGVDRAHAYINGFRFRSYCYSLGLTPRFTGYDSSGRYLGYGDFSDSTGYWKTLIDRPMYDRSGAYRAQQVMNVTEICQSIDGDAIEGVLGSGAGMLSPEYGREFWGENAQTPDTGVAARAAERYLERNGERQYSAEAAEDEEYIAAVNAGDLDTAQRMVDEAAKAAGYDYVRYTRNKLSPRNNAAPYYMFTEADNEDRVRGGYGNQKYVASSEGAINASDVLADLRKAWSEYAEEHDQQPYVTDEELNPSDITESAGVWDDMDFVTYLFDHGFFDDLTDEEVPALKTENGLLVFGDDYKRVKSADPVTYDDQGNVISLSERFNPQEQDIRYSAESDSDDAERETPDTPALQKLGVKIAGSKGRYGLSEQLLARDKAAKQLMKATKKAEQKLKATQAEREFASGIASGIYSERDIPATLNRDTVKALAEYYWAEKSFEKDMLTEVRSQIYDELEEEAESLLEDADFRPMSMLMLNERTPERSLRRMFGASDGGRIFDWLIRPVQVNESEKTRWFNRQMDRVRTFTDSTGKQRALTREESALTMLVMEGKAAAAAVADIEAKGGDAKAIRNAANNILKGDDPGDAAREFSLKGGDRALAEQYAQWMGTQERLKNADSTIVENAAEAYAKIFDEFYDGINDFLVAHGYEPIGYIKGYAPHMQPEQYQTMLEKAFKAMGINETVTGLPASIAGETAFFKPNKRWDPYFLHRTGTEAEYDIEKAYQSYVDYLSDILYHMDDIMRVRTAVKYLRKQYAPEDIREEIDRIKYIRSAPPEDRLSLLRDNGMIGKTTQLSQSEIAERLDEWAEKAFANLKDTTQYSNLVMWLDNYANILAGKQSFADRGWEYSLGRKSLNMANRISNAFQRSLVAGSITSSLNQMAQIPMIKAELGDGYYYRAIADILSGAVKKAGFQQESDFLVSKAGRNILYEDNYDKFINALFKPANVMDDLVSTIAVRGAYLKGVSQGMSHAEAMRYADSFGRNVMGSREKGTRPLAYESKGFFSKMIHMFQVEVANQWDHIASDIPQEVRKIAETKGKGKAARTVAALIVRALLSAFVLNRLAEEAYGGTPAPFDILGLMAGFVASGKGLTTNDYLRSVIDNGLEKIGRDRYFGTETAREGLDVGAAAEELGYNVMNDVPLLRNIAGVLGMGDQTVPLPGAGGEVSDFAAAIGNLVKEGVDEGEIGELIRATIKLGAQFVPAGRQLTKTGEGIEAVVRGGSYSKKGKLQYPVEGAADTARAILFGKNATHGAQAHWASGESTLSDNQTLTYETLTGFGISGAEARKFITDVTGYTADKDERGNSIAGSKKAKVLDRINELDLTPEQKDELYFAAGYGESTVDEAPWNSGGSGGEKDRAPADTNLLRRAPTGTMQLPTVEPRKRKPVPTLQLK